MTFRFPARSTNQQQAGAMAEGGGRPAPVRVSVFRRLLVRVTPAERLTAADGGKDIYKQDERPASAGGEAEVGSVALDRMVLSFMEDSAAAVERPPRGRCNCFNGGGGHQDASDDEDFDFLPSSSAAAAAAPAAAGDALELIKGLVQCASTAERNLLADASRIAERCGTKQRKKAEVRRAVAEGLRALGYDAAVCRSRWDRGASHPAGEHEYIDAVVAVPSEEDHDSGATTTRLVVEVDFRSEFEVARPTKAYRSALQALPPLFVGTPERLGRVVAVVAEAARQSLRKRGLHFPPWRKPEYMRAKWLAPHARDDDSSNKPSSTPPLPPVPAGEFELRFDEAINIKSPNATGAAREDAGNDEAAEEKITAAVVAPSPSPWRPVVEVEPGVEASEQQSPQQPAKGRVVTGLASVL